MVMQPFTKNGNYPFVEAATYPDDIKYLNWKTFNSWHFNDNYFSDDGSSIDITRDPSNIVWAIDEAKNTLMNHKTS